METRRDYTTKHAYTGDIEELQTDTHKLMEIWRLVFAYKYAYRDRRHGVSAEAYTQYIYTYLPRRHIYIEPSRFGCNMYFNTHTIHIYLYIHMII